MNKKILMIVAQEGFQEIEYGEPRRALEKNGHEVRVASFEPGAAVGAQGLVIRVDYGVKDVNVENFDAVVFIGGGGMVPLVDDDRFIELAKKFSNAGKIVSAICIAPMILANAGLLDGKTATVFPSAENDLKNRGANYTGANVEVDGNIITGNGPGVAKGFGEALVHILSK